MLDNNTIFITKLGLPRCNLQADDRQEMQSHMLTLGNGKPSLCPIALWSAKWLAARSIIRNWFTGIRIVASERIARRSLIRGHLPSLYNVMQNALKLINKKIAKKKKNQIYFAYIYMYCNSG